MKAKSRSPQRNSDLAKMRRLLTSREAAKYLRIQPKTLALMRERGDGPEYTKAGRILYDLTDLNKWIDARRRLFTGQIIPPQK